ncbi:MAG: hypothetical protein AseanaTS_21720 [Candidatus Pelagadaptatus aseana]
MLHSNWWQIFAYSGIIPTLVSLLLIKVLARLDLGQGMAVFMIKITTLLYFLLSDITYDLA